MPHLTLSDSRSDLHRNLFERLTEIRPNKFGAKQGAISSGRPCYSMADTDNDLSIGLASHMVDNMVGGARWTASTGGDKSGREFQKSVAAFLAEILNGIKNLAFSPFEVIVPVQRGHLDRRLPTDGDPKSTSTIANFGAYAHLLAIDDLIQSDGRIRAAFGGDYFVRPDVLVWRRPVSTARINASGTILDAASRKRTRSAALVAGGGGNILHASVSCKWTMRSDRAQNSRTEALNLMRNRKGRVPHIVAVVMEPLPSRIASIAQGTGDMDCTYHCALPELQDAMQEVLRHHPTTATENEARILNALIDGQRLRDVADLPFDLLV